MLFTLSSTPTHSLVTHLHRSLTPTASRAGSATPGHVPAPAPAPAPAASSSSGHSARLAPLPWTSGQPLDVIFLHSSSHHVVPYSFGPPSAFSFFPFDGEPIGLDLYDFHGHPLSASALAGGEGRDAWGHGYLLRFTLLEWDDVRVERLLLSLKRSLREGAEAHISRVLLHDDHWTWRLQLTIYLGPYTGWLRQAFVRVPRLGSGRPGPMGGMAVGVGGDRTVVAAL